MAMKTNIARIGTLSLLLMSGNKPNNMTIPKALSKPRPIIMILISEILFPRIQANRLIIAVYESILFNTKTLAANFLCPIPTQSSHDYHIHKESQSNAY